jgi:hypothetical protein
MVTSYFVSLVLLFTLVYTSAAGPLVPNIQTTSGVVKEAVNKRSPAVLNYLSVPYAQPLVGPLRFALPQTISQPEALIDGTQTAKSCSQFNSVQPNVYLIDVPLSSMVIFGMETFQPTSKRMNLLCMMNAASGVTMRGNIPRALFWVISNMYTQMSLDPCKMDLAISWAVLRSWHT